ncbi:hypothetical protein RBSWK_01711 [Rhodopirellula baltica SWK14]|uniref:Uncharacterized protein n=1 Tax=Rhodopirellula baltica SWK14 TaxID=993516 RepID=L7CL16_RHOBT|nr:hypothetical protein RBSWK_01711 [Rhodopirellula baltica SWK14]
MNCPNAAVHCHVEHSKVCCLGLLDWVSRSSLTKANRSRGRHAKPRVRESVDRIVCVRLGFRKAELPWKELYVVSI